MAETPPLAGREMAYPAKRMKILKKTFAI